MAENSNLALWRFNSRRPEVGILSVNRGLRNVGVGVNRVPIPQAARDIWRSHRTRALTRLEPVRQQVARLAGRKPAVDEGGCLSPRPGGMAPYPKVYDTRAMNTVTKQALQMRHCRLHINASARGVDIDEVMTAISCGPWTWFFGLADGVWENCRSVPSLGQNFWTQQEAAVMRLVSAHQ